MSEPLIANRTRDFAGVVEELEALTYSVAHDLRVPLRPIHGLSIALLVNYGHQLDASGLDNLLRIGRSSDRMSQLGGG